MCSGRRHGRDGWVCRPRCAGFRWRGHSFHRRRRYDPEDGDLQRGGDHAGRLASHILRRGRRNRRGGRLLWVVGSGGRYQRQPLRLGHDQQPHPESGDRQRRGQHTGRLWLAQHRRRDRCERELRRARRDGHRPQGQPVRAGRRRLLDSPNRRGDRSRHEPPLQVRNRRPVSPVRVPGGTDRRCRRESLRRGRGDRVQACHRS